MAIKKIFQNPFLLFSPILIFLLFYVLDYQLDLEYGDQTRYLSYAHNLIKGFYSLPWPNIDLGNGPGYPLLLAPILALKLPLVFALIINVILFYFSVIFIYKALLILVTKQLALITSFFWILCLNVYEWIPRIYPETLAVFLVSIICFSIIKSFKPEPKSNRFLCLSGLLIGYLALTKPVFGYVIIFLIFGSFLFCILNRKSANIRKIILILIIALTSTTPYLVYTYHLSGKVFYWSSFGGDNLYWMSSPFKNEYGDWQNFNKIYANSKDIGGGNNSLFENHKDIYSKIKDLPAIEKDDVLKSYAMQNIKNRPLKFLSNCLSNVGRILFNFPYSYTLQKPQTLLRLPLNGIITFLAFICLIPTLFNWKNLPYSIRFLFFFNLLYFGGSVLGSAETRMFSVIIPSILIWISFVIAKTIKFSIKF